ncbi:MAG: twin-arginine translocase TatA/TatE family subunit [Halobacteriales archaeon]
MVPGTEVLAPLQFGVPGGMELAVILLIAVLLFGANKIPKLARSTGQAMGEFRRGHEEVKQELEEMQEDEDQPAGGAPETGPTSADDTTATQETTSAETSSAAEGSEDQSPDASEKES